MFSFQTGIWAYWALPWTVKESSHIHLVVDMASKAKENKNWKSFLPSKSIGLLWSVKEAGYGGKYSFLRLVLKVTWKICIVVWFTSLCLMPSHSRGLLVWESKIMATSPFFVVLVLFLIILLFVQYPSNTMVRAQLDSKGPILTIKCGKDHCVVLEARHFSHLASFYSRPGFTKPRFTNLGFDTQGDEYG